MPSSLLQCAQLNPMCFQEVGKLVFFALKYYDLKSRFINCCRRGYSVAEKTELHCRKG
jgi:hypothetical protein